ncbi:MAG TPA: hypothetical protein VI452_17905 [Marmoricola sp.]
MRPLFTTGSARWWLLGTAVLQLVSPAVIPFDGGSARDLPVVPPSFFFGIWSVITIGCVAAAAWGMPQSRASRPPYRRVQMPVSVVQVLFIVWLVLARFLPPLTVLVFATMLALLTYAMKVVVSSPADRVTRVLLGGSLGLYAGWTAGAVWLNLVTVLPLEVQGDRAVLATALLAAAATCVSGALFFRGSAGFVVGATWACMGILLTSAMAGEVGLAAVAAAGLLATLIAGALASRRHRTSTAQPPREGRETAAPGRPRLAACISCASDRGGGSEVSGVTDAVVLDIRTPRRRATGAAESS